MRTTHRPGVVLAAIAFILLSSLHLTADAAIAVPIHEVPAGTAQHWTDADPQDIADYGPTTVQAFIDAYWRQVWIDTYWSRIAALTDVIERARVTYPSGQCGGDLPPCWVMRRESRGDIRAENPRSTASGKWQFLDGTWGGFGGYSHASHAPEQVQDARARQLWAGGRGCSHWSAC